MSTATSLTAIILGVGAISSIQAQQPAPTGTSPAAASSHHRQETASPGQAGGGSAHEASLGNTDQDGADPAKFVQKAAQGGLTEVALSKAAKATSQDPKIQQFADRMLRDHGQANEELTRIAKSKGLAVPTSLDSEHQANLQKLSHQKGTAFDTAYSKQMQKDHEKTIALFRGAEQSSDPQLAAFAKKILPTLTEHEQMANALPGATRTANAQP